MILPPAYISPWRFQIPIMGSFQSKWKPRLNSTLHFQLHAAIHFPQHTVCTCYMVTSLSQTPIFDWWVLRWGSKNNTITSHIKKELDHVFIDHSTCNSEHNKEDTCIQLRKSHCASLIRRSWRHENRTECQPHIQLHSWNLDIGLPRHSIAQMSW